MRIHLAVHQALDWYFGLPDWVGVNTPGAAGIVGVFGVLSIGDIKDIITICTTSAVAITSIVCTILVTRQKLKRKQRNEEEES